MLVHTEEGSSTSSWERTDPFDRLKEFYVHENILATPQLLLVCTEQRIREMPVF